MNRLCHFVTGGDPSRLWVRYAVAVTLVVVLLVGAHLYQKSQVETFAAHSELVTLAHRQERLSQEILALATDVYLTRSVGLSETLGGRIAFFRDSHAAIMTHPALSPEMRAVYAGTDGLDAASSRYADLAEAVRDFTAWDYDRSAALAELRRAGRTDFLAALGRATHVLETEAARHEAKVRRTQDLALYSALAILVLEGLAIFWPAQRMVNRSIAALEEMNDAMRVTNEQLYDYAGKLAASAFQDPLTGLSNRKRLWDDLGKILEGRREGDAAVCVMHLDLDRFKEVNDTLGHAVGDAVLKRVAEIIGETTRRSDLATRVGGDEFVLVAQIGGDDPQRSAQVLAETLIERIRQPILAEGNEVHVGASIGYTFVAPGDRDPERLIADADIALYAAKREGRGRAQRFTRSMRGALEERSSLIRDIETAFENGEFVPWLQPQVSLADGRILGFEALARWVHPERGVLLPARFIEVAEEIGVIDAIDTRLMVDGFAALVQLRRSGWVTPRLAVNVAARTLRQADFPDRLGLAVEACGLSPQDIALEMREATLLDCDAETLPRTVARLHEAGFHIEIDDFGAGYAALGILSRLEVTGVKIDRGLVSSIEEARTQQVVSAIVGLAGAMELSVTAGGVESGTQFRHLRAIGATAAQGFAIAPPMPLDDLMRWLAERGSYPGVAEG